MAADELESGALRFPMRKKCPPTYAARFFPGSCFRVVVAENHAGRIRNREHGDGVVILGPLNLPRGTLNQLPLVATIPKLRAGEDHREPRKSAPLVRHSPLRTR